MVCWVNFLWGGTMINGMDHLVGDDQGIKFPLEMEEVFQRTDLEREREIEEGKTLYLKFSPEIKEMLRSAAERSVLFIIKIEEEKELGSFSLPALTWFRERPWIMQKEEIIEEGKTKKKSFFGGRRYKMMSDEELRDVLKERLESIIEDCKKPERREELSKYLLERIDYGLVDYPERQESECRDAACYLLTLENEQLRIPSKSKSLIQSAINIIGGQLFRNRRLEMGENSLFQYELSPIGEM
jgi:hypothetical protein